MSSIDDKDAALLAELGYEQKLNRSWGTLKNFVSRRVRIPSTNITKGVSFSIISIVTGMTLGELCQANTPEVSPRCSRMAYSPAVPALCPSDGLWSAL